MEPVPRPMEAGRALLAAGRTREAAEAFARVLAEWNTQPKELIEASVCLIQTGADYRPAYDALLRLYEDGHSEALPILDEAFYLPNEKELRTRYRKNCRLLKKYPYLFRRDFPAFEDLPVRLYPYDEETYIPYLTEDGVFGVPYHTETEVVSRNFFGDLSKPVLADGVYSRYELAYLRDNVRRSEDVGYENHVYLHYPRWEDFCALLQAVDMRPLLREEKFVFLIGEERDLYPIDFAARFGIDYSRFPLKPVGIREITKVIWHAQLSTHNGGDFFNEIFDFHPNLLAMTSILMEDVERMLSLMRELLGKCRSGAEAREHFRHWHDPGRAEELYNLKDRTDRDFLTALFLTREDWNRGVDPAARIAPALFFQPHFREMLSVLRPGPDNTAYLEPVRGEAVPEILRGYPYVKTFVPVRRFTTSYGGSIRWHMNAGIAGWLERTLEEAGNRPVELDPLPLDAISYRVLSRGYLADPDERLLRDSTAVRFEDGKTNPKAILPRLAAFLDLPYTQSMTYCSARGQINPGAEWGEDLYAAGFSLASVYKTYDGWLNDSERRFLEFCFRDAYRAYGYDFQWYDGQPMDREALAALTADFSTQDRLIRQEWEWITQYFCPAEEPGQWRFGQPDTLPVREWDREEPLRRRMEEYRAFRLAVGTALGLDLRFVNRRGIPLRLLPLLRPDPERLERPLYH